MENVFVAAARAWKIKNFYQLHNLLIVFVAVTVAFVAAAFCMPVIDFAVAFFVVVALPGQVQSYYF